MIRNGFLIAIGCMLSACGTVPKPDPVIVTKEVKVPVAVSCVPHDMPGKPVYVDSDDALKTAPDAAERYRLVAAGRIQRENRLEQVESVLAGCRGDER